MVERMPSPLRIEPSLYIADPLRLQSLFLGAVQAAIIATDLNGNITYWNSFAERLYGWSSAEVTGRSIMEITVSSDNEDEARQHMADVLAGNHWAGEFGVRCKDGRKLSAFVTLSAVKDESGAAVGIVGVSQDLASLKEAEGALRRSEEQFQAFANSLPELCWMAHSDGHLFWYNDRWYEYTGTTPQQMEGWGWQSVHDPEILPVVIKRWKSSIQTGAAFEMEFPLRGADGVFRWFLTRIKPLHDADGKLIRWYGTNTNIDEQRRLLKSLSEVRDDLEKEFWNELRSCTQRQIAFATCRRGCYACATTSNAGWRGNCMTASDNCWRPSA